MKNKSSILYLFLSFSTLLVGLYWFFNIEEPTDTLDSLLYNADALYAPHITRELFERGFAYIAGWMTPSGGNYFYPDIVLSLLVQWPLGDLVGSIILYAVLQFSLLVLLHFLIALEIFPEARKIELLVVIFFSSSLLLFLAGFEGTFHNLDNIFSSQYHTGSYLAASLNIYLLLRYARLRRILYLILVILSAGLAVMSDKFHLLHFVLPSLLAWLFFFFRKRKTLSALPVWPLVLIPFCLVAAKFYEQALSRISGVILFKYPFFGPLYEKIAGGNFQLSAVSTFLGWWFNSVLGPVWLLAILWYFVALVFLFRSRGVSDEADTPESRLAISAREIYVAYTLFGAVLLGAAVVLFGAILQKTALRYGSAIFMTPFLSFFVLVFLIHSDKVRRAVVYLIFPVLVLSVSLYSLFHMEKTPQEILSYKPAAVSCLEQKAKEHSVNIGFGNFWVAKTTDLFSEGKLRILQMDSNLVVYYWINNYYWYFELKKEKGNKLIVMKKMNRELILEKIGEPSVVERCGEVDVFIYKQPELGRLNRYSDDLIRKVRIWETLAGRKPFDEGLGEVD